jgi:hypothetical protein
METFTEGSASSVLEKRTVGREEISEGLFQR